MYIKRAKKKLQLAVSICFGVNFRFYVVCWASQLVPQSDVQLFFGE